MASFRQCVLHKSDRYSHSKYAVGHRKSRHVWKPKIAIQSMESHYVDKLKYIHFESMVAHADSKHDYTYSGIE